MKKLSVAALCSMMAICAQAAGPDTQALTIPFTPADQVLGKMSLPAGFTATLAAAEPMVTQPIAMTFDDRGRLWVVECDTYAENPRNFDTTQRDRVVIFEDSDHDGRFDKRTVFWDQGIKATGLAVGLGGVWVTAAPNLLFIPDQNGDDKPDGDPVVALDGFNADQIRHNIVNGLCFGPDGWIYGRHGIQAVSFVGAPGMPKDQRTAITAGVWRYHPVRKTVQVVASGTTNPWGTDFDQHGEMFMINTVIGHLWHVIPGAHFQRMYGEDPNRRVYELLPQTADHFHWDTAEKWSDIRKAGVTKTTDSAGGGHAHCGMMIYQADNWPEEYRNKLYTINYHGLRLNCDQLDRTGCGYVGRHLPDHWRTTDPWFRGIDLAAGPDGGVYLLDWSDIGECHDNDGIHRSSGRIYKIYYGSPGAPAAPALNDISKLPDDQLVKLLAHANVWYARRAQLQLQQRAITGANMKPAHQLLRAMFESNASEVQQLRAMWALQVTGGADESWLRLQLADKSEHIRCWALRFLTDSGPASDAAITAMESLAAKEDSGLVRMYLASTLQKLPNDRRWNIAEALARYHQDGFDRWQPLMLWYGIEAAVPTNRARAVRVLEQTRIPQLRKLITRRLTEDIETNPEPLNVLLNYIAYDMRVTARMQREVIQGMSDALRGWKKAKAPAIWSQIEPMLAARADAETKIMLRELSIVFGDGRGLDALKRIALDAEADGDSRRAAIKTLIAAHPDDLADALVKLAEDRITSAVAVQGLAAYNHPNAARTAINRFKNYTPEERPAVIDALVTRLNYADHLLKAVAEGKLDRRDISAHQARQIRTLGDAKLDAKLSEVWGDLRTTAADKQQLITRYRALLTPQTLAAASPSRGRAVFNQLCAACHTLYGQGGKIGPDLTGSNRADLGYLLENIVDPSAVVAADFRMTILKLTDGRMFSGIVAAQTDRTLTLQTPTEQQTLDRTLIAQTTQMPLSLMPEGQLLAFTDEQIVNLFAYLMSKEQVPLP